MAVTRGRVAIPLLMSVGIMLAGCATSTTEFKTSAPTISSSTTGYDLDKLADISGSFPPDFAPPPFQQVKIDQAYVRQVGAVVSYGKPFTTVPSQCSALLKPVDGQQGASTNGSRADGPDEQSIAVNADAPVTVVATIPVSDCNRMTFDVQTDTVRTRGVAERIAAPSIDGATTYALKIQIDELPSVEYFYAAIIDNRLFVTVAARIAPSSSVAALLPDLLVKAAAAVRSR